MRCRLWYIPPGTVPNQVALGETFRVVSSPVEGAHPDSLNAKWNIVTFRVEMVNDVRGDLTMAYVQIKKRLLTGDEIHLFDDREPEYILDDTRLESSLPPGTFD